MLELQDLARGTTVGPNIIAGGTVSNTVASAAKITVDVRAWTRDEQRRLDRGLRELAPNLAGAEITLRGGWNRPPMESSPASVELFLRTRQIGLDLGLDLQRVAWGGLRMPISLRLWACPRWMASARWATAPTSSANTSWPTSSRFGWRCSRNWSRRWRYRPRIGSARPHSAASATEATRTVDRAPQAGLLRGGRYRRRIADCGLQIGWGGGGLIFAGPRWDLDREHRSLVVFAAHRDLASHGVHEFAADRKPRPEPSFRRSGWSRTNSSKTSATRSAGIPIPVSLTEISNRITVTFGAKCHRSSSRGVLEAVVDQVAYDLLESSLVGPCRRRGNGLQTELDLSSFGEWPHLLDDRGQRRRDFNAFDLQPDATGLESREIHHVENQATEPEYALMADLDIRHLLVRQTRSQLVEQGFQIDL